MAEILLVDDERVLRDGMKQILTAEGYEVRTARNGDDAIAKFSEKRPDLILLDVMMPKMNGFRACEEIRKFDRTMPIIFLTAKDSETDQVRGIGLGADDYILKTSSESVLIARIRRALERSMSFDMPKTVVRLGKVEVDLDRLLVMTDKTQIRLTRTEADVLRILSQERGSFISRSSIVEKLRGTGFVCEDGVVYTHIYNLRKKLGAAASYIVSDHSKGYMLVR